MVTMFEEAYKKQPGNEDLAAQTFFANVRAQRWKFAQQVHPFRYVYPHEILTSVIDRTKDAQVFQY